MAEVKPSATELGTHELDVQALYEAFRAVCDASGKHTTSGIGQRLGINPASLSRMKRGQYQRMYAAPVLRICAWAGLNPLQFLRRPADNSQQGEQH